MTNNIQEIRKQKKISRYKMAKDLNMNYTTLVNWEKSESLSINKLQKALDYLGNS